MKKNILIPLLLGGLLSAAHADIQIDKAIWTSHLEVDQDTKGGVLEPQEALQHGSQGYPVALWLKLVNPSQARSEPQTLSLEISYRRIVCTHAGGVAECELDWHMAEKTYKVAVGSIEPKSVHGQFRTGFLTKDTQNVSEILIRVLDQNGKPLQPPGGVPLDIVIY